MAPLIQSFAEDRLTHLFRARGAHCSFVLVEAQAPRLEGQAAILEQPPHFGLGVLDQRLVMDAMHSAGQYGIEVRHELDVVDVIAADVVEVVAEALAPGEMLFESREAISQRVAPDIDDPRARQHQVDEADMPEVVRHLVDEEWRGWLTLHTGSYEILLTERAQALGSQCADDLEILAGPIVLPARLETARQRDHVVQLHRALHEGVARQNLVDESGARARQSDDEYGIRQLAAHVAPLGEEFPRVTLARAPYETEVLVRAVAHEAAAQPVALGIMLDRGFVLRLVLVGLAESKMQVKLVLERRWRRGRLECRLHRSSITRLEPECFEIGEAEISLAHPR